MPLRKSMRPKSATVCSAVICAVLTGLVMQLAVPMSSFKSEAGRAAEAFRWLLDVHSAQLEHRISSGGYSPDLDGLGSLSTAPRGFKVIGPSSTDWRTNWEIQCVRSRAEIPNGEYSISFDETGFLPDRSSVPSAFRLGG